MRTMSKKRKTRAEKPPCTCRFPNRLVPAVLHLAHCLDEADEQLYQPLQAVHKEPVPIPIP